MVKQDRETLSERVLCDTAYRKRSLLHLVRNVVSVASIALGVERRFQWHVSGDTRKQKHTPRLIDGKSVHLRRWRTCFSIGATATL